MRIHRHVPLVILIALTAGCDRSTDPESPDQAANAPAFGASDKIIDPAALTPAPSQVGATAECQLDGQWIVCHTALSIELVNEPLLDFPPIPCGTLYETSTDVRLGIRWYNAADSVIVKRHVTQSVEGTWSLSPDGSGPTVKLKVSGNWYDSDYADPNDLDSGTRESHGESTFQAPGYGVIAHVAGLDLPDGTHRGAFRVFEDPAVAAKLCAALTR